MTPQEITDHKRTWMMANYFESCIHSDYRDQATTWCKEHCFKWRYDIKRFTDVYEDSVRFELKEDYDAFNEWYWQRDVFESQIQEHTIFDPDPTLADNITRFEVIDHTGGGGGRDWVKYLNENEQMFICLQDNNTTLKIFFRDKEPTEVL